MVNQLDVEDEVGFSGDFGIASVAVGQLPGDEETTLAANVHALEARIPAGDDAVGSVGKGEGGAAVDGGVEFGAVGEPAGVVDGVVLAGFSEGACADDGVDVAERVKGFGGACDFGDAGRIVRWVRDGFGCGGGVVGNGLFRGGC